MGEDKVRFSDVCKDFNADLEALPPGDLDPIREAFAANVVGRTFGNTDKTDDVADLGPVLGAVPKDLKLEARQFQKAFDRECGYRGDNWRQRSAVLTLVEHLPALAPATSEAPKAKGKGKK